MGRCHTHVWQLNIRMNVSAVGVPLEETGVPASYQAPQPRFPMLGREMLSCGWVRWKAAKVSGIPLSGVTYYISQTNLLWDLVLGWQLEEGGCLGRPGRSWIVWYLARDRGPAFSKMEVLVEAIVSWLGPPPQSWKVPYLSLHQPG